MSLLAASNPNALSVVSQPGQKSDQEFVPNTSESTLWAETHHPVSLPVFHRCFPKASVTARKEKEETPGVAQSWLSCYGTRHHNSILENPVTAELNYFSCVEIKPAVHSWGLHWDSPVPHKTCLSPGLACLSPLFLLKHGKIEVFIQLFESVLTRGLTLENLKFPKLHALENNVLSLLNLHDNK